MFKNLLIILVALIAISCTHHKCDNCKQTYHVENVSLSEYKGKTISHIQTDSHVTSQHDIVIHFTDGTNLTIVANKYVLDIYK